MVGKPETTLAEGGRPGWSIFGYHYPLLLVNFQLSQSRHSYAVELYSKGKDLRAVQKQLRHASIQSTIVYADVTDETIGEQLKGLWN